MFDKAESSFALHAQVHRKRDNLSIHIYIHVNFVIIKSLLYFIFVHQNSGNVCSFVFVIKKHTLYSGDCLSKLDEHL